MAAANESMGPRIPPCPRVIFENTFIKAMAYLMAIAFFFFQCKLFGYPKEIQL
jgi:hypothetical protein